MTGSYVHPPDVSERHGDGPYTHCVACAVLMAVLGHAPGSAPATYAEADALYQQAHPYPGGGESMENVIAVAETRYHLTKRVIVGGNFTELWGYLVPGHAASAIIRPANLPAAHILRKYVGLKFTGEHGIMVQRRDTRVQVRAYDPMYPQSSTYTGVYVSEADLRTAYVGSAAIFGIAKTP